MVFLIQNTQNRDAKAVHLKLDEIIRAIKGARNELVDLEELSDEDLKNSRNNFSAFAKRPSTMEIMPKKANVLGRAKINWLALQLFAPRRFARKLFRSDTAGKFRIAGSPVSSHNSDAVRAR
jgi:Low affinity iron permease